MGENMKRREFVEEMVSENSSKKRKLGNDVVELPESSAVNKSLRVTDLESVVDDDLKVKDCETDTEFSTSINGFSSELSGEESESSTTSKTKPKKKKSCRRNTTTSKMPSEAELEEFFGAEEKYQQKQFAEKYNFDVVKDVPLQGKYQWVRLQ